MFKQCSLCGGATATVIYFGLPGRLCVEDRCSALTGLAAYAPPVASEDDSGQPSFSFMVYDGSYWRALWQWLVGRG